MHSQRNIRIIKVVFMSIGILLFSISLLIGLFQIICTNIYSGIDSFKFYHAVTANYKNIAEYIRHNIPINTKKFIVDAIGLSSGYLDQDFQIYCNDKKIALKSNIMISWRISAKEDEITLAKYLEQDGRLYIIGSLGFIFGMINALSNSNNSINSIVNSKGDEFREAFGFYTNIGAKMDIINKENVVIREYESWHRLVDSARSTAYVLIKIEGEELVNNKLYVVAAPRMHHVRKKQSFIDISYSYDNKKYLNLCKFKSNRTDSLSPILDNAMCKSINISNDQIFLKYSFCNPELNQIWNPTIIVSQNRIEDIPFYLYLTLGQEKNNRLKAVAYIEKIFGTEGTMPVCVLRVEKV